MQMILPRAKVTIWYLFALLFIVTSACRQDRHASILPENVGAYVYGFTSGIISREDPVRVRFASQVASMEQVGQEADASLINFSPKIEGRAVWEDEQTLRFEPNELLRSGTVYVARVDLRALFDNLPDDVQDLEFEFHTRNQYFEVNTEGLFPPNLQVLNEQALKGNVITSDLAEDQAVEELLSAKQDGRNLDIDWVHAGNEHTFTVQGIERTDTPEEITLSWNGRPLDLDIKGSKNIEVPALGDFKMTEAQVVRGNEKFIRVHFSDPLLSNQNLDGLVTITDYTGSLRFVVEGNDLRVYPSERLVGTRRVMVSPGIRNINNQRMEKAGVYEITFEDVQPAVRLAGNGVILPESEGLVFPFEAIGLHAVEVEVFKIYSNNILQFLQTNELDGEYDLHRVGRVIMQRRVDLMNLNADGNPGSWTRYALDLNELFKKDKEAIYQVRIGFRPAYSNYFCNNQSSEQLEAELLASEGPFDANGEIQSIMDSWYGIDGYYEGYRWDQRNDPCFPAYYNSDRFVQRNVLASNLGIIAKGGDNGKYLLAVSDLRTAAPLSGVRLEFFDYQKQSLQTAQTNAQGIAEVSLDRAPFVVVASQGLEKGYLKMGDGNSLSLSRFDVSGAVTQKGLKGYLYGDRGVWRPGDSVFLNFVLEDRQNILPPNYPIQFELYDPRGQLHTSRSTADNKELLYPLYFATRADAPTGSWLAKVKAGGATFQKTLKIETVKPNRLKIDLNLAQKDMLRQADEPLEAELQVNWLHGAPASGLEAKVEVQLSGKRTTFPKFDDFVFDDPARQVDQEARTVFDGDLNSNGHATFTTKLVNTHLLPGFLNANFKTRVFEKGGDFSTDNFTVPYSPFAAYSGIAIPTNKYGEKRLDLGQDEQLRFVAVDEKGTPLSNRRLSVGLYRVNWRWWWDEGYDNVSRYNNSNHFDATLKEELMTQRNGEANWQVNIDEWGRYLVRICDTESGHCSGDFFYAGYPWDGDDEQGRAAAAMLNFSSDKSTYNVGDEVSLTIPSAEAGRALITIENGSQVVESFWRESKNGENTFTFRTTEAMTPNVYAHVSLLQPHAQKENDLPIRMYGVIPIMVEDPGTHLHPEINMPETLRPEQEVTISVSEADGKPMAYTLALVDEGLLSLTRFKTPNPWDAFYAREALGVQSWDVYDAVVGAQAGEMERILSIGGDGELPVNPDDQNANRFKPVVMHLGPFQLRKGKTEKHTLHIPNYVGAVRAMVIASAEGAYGSADKTVPVKKPLMVLATLPRVLGPGESLDLPVNVFAMEDKVKSVKVSVAESSGLIQLGNASQSISFNRVGDQLVRFPIKVADRTGIARFTVKVEGNGESATQDIEIEIRNPNPYITNVVRQNIKAGESWSPVVELPGMEGTNTVQLEVSAMPPINLGKRLDYLLHYPYGCIEQTISSGFPQLYVDRLIPLDDKQKAKIPTNIEATIDRLKLFQTDQGGFAYWPGDDSPDQWATSYAGHFLLEAKALGYTVSNLQLEKWAGFQKKVARNWDPSLKEDGYISRRAYDLTQSYRLYTLALAGKAELGAMNRLRESSKLETAAKWNLAAAYALAGKSDVAKQLISGLTTDVAQYSELSYTYGSDLRDRAMILEALTVLGEENMATDMLMTISEGLSNQRWLSTQTTSFCLLAVGKFAGKHEMDDKLDFAYQLPGARATNVGSDKPMILIDIPGTAAGQAVKVDNKGKGLLFARLITSGQPIAGYETAAENSLGIAVVYKNLQNQVIDPSVLPQGTDFIAEVKIKHPGIRTIPYQEMALDQIFPSGWEVLNTRMDNVQNFEASSNADYQDFRDDRVYTFFDILPGQTRTYRIQLNAAYQGRFYLPAVACKAMYDETINARSAGTWVEVVNPGNG
ncbi:MAG: MG2 domain-containing protein [Saprospiraceae bacterium]